MVGAIPRQPRRFWGVPDWQVSSASCANDRPLWDREIDPEQSRVLLQRGPPKAIAQDRFQVVFEYLQGWRLHNLSSLCPLPLVLSLDTSEKSLAPSSLHPFCRRCIAVHPVVESSPGRPE